MYASVTAALREARITAYIQVLRVLQDQPSPLPEQVPVEDGGGDRLAPFDVVRRIGEDDVELFGAAFQVKKRIGFYRMDIRKTETFGRVADILVVHGVDFDRDDGSRSARGEFVADRTGSRKKIQYVESFDLQAAVQYVEKVLLGEIGGRPRAQVLGRLDNPAPVDAANDSHGSDGSDG